MEFEIHLLYLFWSKLSFLNIHQKSGNIVKIGMRINIGSEELCNQGGTNLIWYVPYSKFSSIPLIC